MTEYYENWQPLVGQQVRYRWQPECPGVEGMLAPVGHPPEYDRCTGTLYEKLTYPRWAGHPYLVVLTVQGKQRHIQCAALEIEPA